jgi:hypothetical protein
MFKRVSSRSIQERWRNFLLWVEARQDVDHVLSYYTRQQVKIMDAKLGITYYVIQVGLILFIVGYLFIFKGGYLAREQAKGAVVTHVSGDAFSKSSGKAGERYFSSEDLTYPGMENGNLFIATRQEVSNQMVGLCEDQAMTCTSDADCSAILGGTCQLNGFCHELSWCDVDEVPEKYEIESDKVTVWARPFIQFIQLAPEKIFYAYNKPAPENVYTVRDLLKKCEPLPINYEEVAELGAVFEVSFRFECDVLVKKEDECEPKVEVRRLDTILDPERIGYSFSYSEYIDDAHRVENKVSGLRFFFRTTGEGRKWSFMKAVNTASNSLTLLSLAIIAVDLLVTRVFANRQKYKARKFEKSPDFSELMGKLEVKRTKDQQLKEVLEADEKTRVKEEEWLRRFQEDQV